MLWAHVSPDEIYIGRTDTAWAGLISGGSQIFADCSGKEAGWRQKLSQAASDLKEPLASPFHPGRTLQSCFLPVACTTGWVSQAWVDHTQGKVPVGRDQGRPQQENRKRGSLFPGCPNGCPRWACHDASFFPTWHLVPTYSKPSWVK